MSFDQFRVAIKNLIEEYIPQWGEANGKEPVFVAEENYVLVFEDPSGVLDIWGCAEYPPGENLDITDDDFSAFLTRLGKQAIGDWSRYMDVHISLRWHSWGPPGDE